MRVPGVDVVIGPGPARALPAPARRSSAASPRAPRAWRCGPDSLPPTSSRSRSFGAGAGRGRGARSRSRCRSATTTRTSTSATATASPTATARATSRATWLKLQNLLGPYFGRAEVRAWGRPGTVSVEGATPDAETLRWYDPAYVLILYGTNDWHDQSARTSRRHELLHDRGAARHDRRHQGPGQPARARDDHARPTRADARGPQPAGTTT